MSHEPCPDETESIHEPSSGRQWTWRRLLGVWALVIAGILGGAELTTRLFTFPFLPYERMSRIHAAVGLPSLNETLVDDKVLFWKAKPGLRDFQVSGKVFQWPIDYRVSTDERGLRVTPDPCPEHEAFRILALGDSCTFGFGVNDDECWPAQLQELLENGGDPGQASSGRHYKVLNAGVPGYTAYQSLQYLRTRGLALKPNLVVLQSWINDVNSWGWGDYKIAAHLEPPVWQQVLLKSRFYQFLGALAFIRVPDRPRLSPEEFTRTLADIVETCQENAIPIVFVVWPDQECYQKGTLKPYPASFAKFAENRSIPCVNVLPAIYGKPGPFYVDVCHGTRAGNAATASLLAPVVLAFSTSR